LATGRKGYLDFIKGGIEQGRRRFDPESGRVDLSKDPGKTRAD
jgi:hypothetical protein